MRTRQDLHNLLLDDLNDRKTWENRQRTWYQMRHNGLRRSRKPGPWAADLHYPLADTIISKLKPYYFEQLFAPETLATFVSLNPQPEALTTSAAYWFDYQIKQKSNIEVEVLSAIDTMLNSGRATVKSCWNPKTKSVEHFAINPLHLIVPKNAVDTVSSGRFAHIIIISKDDYMRDPNYTDKSEAFLKKICGAGDVEAKGDNATRQEKFRREGITYGATPNEIVLWEVYEKDDDGVWYIYTYSPLTPDTDVRPPMGLPYRYSEPTFTDFVYEVKDKGWYSSRGICELVAPHEASLCRLWNEKHDCMTLYNRPYFTADREVPNAANIDLMPGQILPFQIKPVQHNSPPISFDQEMISTRQVAEQRVAMPDFGMNRVMDTGDRRTATEVNAIGEVMSNASDLRMRIFRKSLANLYRVDWALLREFKNKDLVYYFQTTQHTLEADALKGDYDIAPRGSPDGVSKAFNVQKAAQRFQMFNGDPLINQVELRRSVLENDDSQLAPRLLQDPGTAQATQQEDQADEISILNIGFPARVLPSDDDAVHIRTCLEYLVSRQKLGVQFNPISHQRILEHMSAHLQQLQGHDPKLARQVEKEIAALAQQFGAEGQVAA